MASVLILAACTSSPSGPLPPARPGNAARQPTITIRPSQPDLARGIIGRTAPALISLFGQPALDLHEGSARKLQFLNGQCVLDAYLYPQRGQGEAVVTHVDARLPDGRDIDQANCIAALRRR